MGRPRRAVQLIGKNLKKTQRSVSPPRENFKHFEIPFKKFILAEPPSCNDQQIIVMFNGYKPLIRSTFGLPGFEKFFWLLMRLK